jgi:hypothetical protein
MFAFAATQVLGLGIAALGSMRASQGDTPKIRNKGRSMMSGGIVLTGLSRVIETGMATHAAHATADEMTR